MAWKIQNRSVVVVVMTYPCVCLQRCPLHYVCVRVCVISVFCCTCVLCVHRAEYEELKTAKEKAEEDTIFSFKRKKGCQAERKQARSNVPIFVNSTG